MRILIIRHAEAAAIGELGATCEFDRPLTELGHRQARALATALSGKFQPDLIFTSPLLRAVQTSEPLGPATVCELLSPDEFKSRDLANFLADRGPQSVVLVGHNPDVSRFTSWLLGNEGIEFEKGAAALIHFAGKPNKGDGRLEWFVTPEWYLN